MAWMPHNFPVVASFQRVLTVLYLQWYSVIGKNRVNDTGEEMCGMLFYAGISEFEAQLHSEMEKVFKFDELPTEWTYPLIQQKLIKEAGRRGFL
ncbi:MAG: hypothetical protein IJ600_02090 [Lachnospiraceae bacterium]|nr:hypothetical protein [Lachnospiraceae bacterium]